MRAATVALAALVLTGCESTQAKSARLERAAKATKHETGLVVAQQSADVAIERTSVLQDANGAAVVVELRNRSRAALVGLPVSVQVLDQASKAVYANDAPGLDASLVSLASLAPRAEVAWVDDQVTLAMPGVSAVARVGAAKAPGPAELPRMAVTGLKPSRDASGDLAITGHVENRSALEQKRLVVHVVARKGDKVVAAARAIVERLAPGKGAHFSAFPIGDPSGAALSASAPPTVVAP